MNELKFFKVKEQPPEFLKETLNNDFYALVYSHSISKINDGIKIKDDSNPDHLNGYVKISAGKISVYRKCRAYRGIKSDEVCLGNRTRAELKNPSEVQISSSQWFTYNWNNSDNGKKHSFRIAVWGIILTILSSVLEIISFICNF